MFNGGVLDRRKLSQSKVTLRNSRDFTGGGFSRPSVGVLGSELYATVN